MASNQHKVDRQNSEESADSLKTLNEDLRNHLVKLRSQLESQKGSIKQAQWQKVLNVRNVRELEQEKYAQSMDSLRSKLKGEKNRELENLRTSLQLRHESEMLRLVRQKDVEITKLGQELDLKERMLRKLLGENRRGSLNLTPFAKRNKLLNELSELRTCKKELTETLEQVNGAERQHDLELRRTADSWESELQRIRRDAHLEIKNLIEQLKNKDKIISHLEKELGQTAGYAVSLQLDRNHQNKMSATAANTSNTAADRQLSVSSPLKHNQALKSFSFDSPLCEKKKSEECMELETESNQSDDNILDKQAVKKLKDLEERHKSLKERNRKFLEKNVDLTTDNRNLKDQISSLTDDHGKLKEQAEHSKRKATVYARQLSQEKLRLVNLENQLIEFEKLRQELAHQTKIITSLKQACSEKDRRMELIQHHKKRKKLRRSQEKCCGVKETFYGYDEDDRSVDSENSLSLSSASHGTMSDDELWDELSREDKEKSYQKLMKEHLQLERSHALVMKNTDNFADPQRTNKLRCDLEHDLIMSQGRIEELEQILQSTGKDDMCNLLRERDRLLNIIDEFQNQKQELFSSRSQLEEDLKEAKDQIDDMEFQILEFQESVDEAPKTTTNENSNNDDDEASEALLKEKLNLSIVSEREARMEIEELRREIATVLEGRGRNVDAILKKLDILKDAEQQITALEVTARELQAKVINLQKEKNHLEDQLSQKEPTSPASEPIVNNDAPDLTQLEMLKLKDQISAHESSELELMEKNIQLQERIAEFEINNQKQNKQIEDLEKSVKLLKKNLATSPKSSPSNSPEVQKSIRNVTKEIEKLVEKTKSEPILSKQKTKSLGNQTDLLAQSNSSDEVKSLEKQLQKMHEENLHLKRKLERKLLDYDSDKSSDDERESRISELEGICEDLKETSYGAELSERHTKEQLKLAEQTINDLEASENQIREKFEKLKNRDSEAKKQVQELQLIVAEMKDVIQDKDIVESALREKVQFLEKVETASNQKISELETSEKYLHEQIQTLEKQSTDPEVVIQLRHQVDQLSTENQRLVSKIAELEEEEEILRDNWRKVADEDAKRSLQQQEKVQLLELLNRELKAKLHESQETAALNLLNSSSIAMELSESQGALETCEQSNEVSDLKLQVRHLEDELLEVTEIKNGKIELLQERIEKFRENEIKLSETVMESEAMEAELKSKLSFYESSQVTVEKILDYEDKLSELRSSQEDLLEQLHSLENHEEDLQEKLDRTEKEYKGKISRLEKEISNHKEREKVSSVKIKNLEKHEEELMEKVTLFTINEKRFKDKIESQVLQITDLKQKIDEKVEKMRELDARKSEMFDQVSKLMENEKQLNSKISELESLVSDYKLSADSKSGSVDNIKQEYMEQIEEMETNAKSQSKRILELQSSLSLDNESKDEKIESLEVQNKQLAEKLETVIAESHARIEELEQMVTDMESREKDMSEKIASADKLISSSRSDVLDSESRIEELITSEQRLKENINHLEKTVVVDLEGEINQLKSKNSELSDMLNDHTSSGNFQLQSLQKKLEDEIENNQSLSKSKCQLEEDLEQTRTHSEEIKQKLRSMELKNEELGKMRTEMEIKMENEQIEISRLRQKIEVLVDAESKLMSRVEEMEESESRLISEIDSLKSNPESSSIKREQSSSLEANMSKRGSISKSEVDNEVSASMKVSSLFQRVQALEAENEEMSSKLSETDNADSTIRSLKEKMRLLEESEDRLMDRIMELEETEEHLREELGKNNDEIDINSFKVREADLKKCLEKMEYEKESLENELQLVEDQLVEEKEKSAKVQEKNKNLERSLKDSKTTTDNLEQDVQDLRSRLNAAEDKFQHEKNKCHQLDTKVKTLTKDCEVLNERMRQEKERDMELSTRLQNEISCLKVERIANETRLQEMVEELREERAKTETKLREQKCNFENLQMSKSQMDEEIDDVKLTVKQLQKDLQTSQKKMEEMQMEHDAKLIEADSKETDLRDKIKEKTRIELDLKKKIHNLEKLVKQNQLDSDDLDEKYHKLEKEHENSVTQNTVLREKIQNLEDELERLNAVDEENNTLKTEKSGFITELEVLKEKLLDLQNLKTQHNTLLEEDSNLKAKIQDLETALSSHQQLEADHESLISVNQQNEERLNILEKQAVELVDLRQAHKKLQVIHDDSESKLKHLKEMMSEFQNLKEKYSEIVQMNQNLENCMVKMISQEEYLHVRKQLDESQARVESLEKEVVETAERSVAEERSHNVMKIHSLETEIDQFSNLKEEYKSLLKIHHAANQTISELEQELNELEHKTEHQTSISTQTDNYLSDVSYESAVFSESSDNDSPTHRPYMKKTEDRTSFMFKEGLHQTKQSISLSSRPPNGEIKMSNGSNTGVKSYILSKPKSIGLPSSRYSISGDKRSKDLENKVSQLEGENSKLKGELDEKLQVIQHLQREIESTTKSLNDIMSCKSSNQNTVPLSCNIGSKTDMGRNILHGNKEDHDLKTKIQNLESEGQLFREKISNLERSNKQLKTQIENNSYDTKKKSPSPEGEKVRSNFLKSKIQFFESGESKTADDKMIDKPEDLLRQQFADMEALRQQVTDLENDRDKLHDKAREDKQIIHNQHIQISELQLAEKMLREQVESLTKSERDLYHKISELEDHITKQDDEIHELQILEKRLKEVVRKTKLDEEATNTKFENMVVNMAELTNSEATLKKTVNDLEKDNDKLNDKIQYFELKVKELENSEMTLNQKLKQYENQESKLGSKLKEMENHQAAAHSQTRELDLMSTDLQKQLDHALAENNMLARHVTELRTQMQEIDKQLLRAKDSEIGLKLQVESLEKSELVLQKRIKEYELHNIDVYAGGRELQQSVAILKDRNSALQRNENRMKHRIQQLELHVGEGQVRKSQEKLPERIEDCHQRIIGLQNLVVALKKSVDENGNHDNQEILSRELWEDIERQMGELGRLNHQLNSLVEEERSGKEISGREVDIAKLNRKLESYQDFLLRLKQNLQLMRGSSLEQPDSDLNQGSNRLRSRDLQSQETKRVMQTVGGLTTPEELTVEGGYIIPLENSPSYNTYRQSDTNRSYSDVLAHEEQIKRDTSGVYESPQVKSVSKEVKKRLIHNKVGEPATADNNIQISNSWTSVAKATSLSQPHQGKGDEELVIGLTLPSESECQSVNDTDSAMSSPDVPRAQKHASTSGSNDSLAPPLPKSLPPALPVKTVFVDESYYLPSFNKGANNSSDGVLDNNRIGTPSRGKDNIMPAPDVSTARLNDNVFVSTSNLLVTNRREPIRNMSSMDSVADSGRGTAASNVGQIQNLVDKIGSIEKQLQGTEESETEDERLFDWKVKANERSQQLEITSSENRQLKNEHPPAVRRRKKINRLEREVEEKNRYISTLDQWLRSFEEIFKNKDIKSDRDIIQQLQSDLVQVKGELSQSGQRKEDITQDPAALQTELNIKNRELSSKRQEVESLLKEIKCWQDECRSIEAMRANALDSLRTLQLEAMELTDVNHELDDLRAEYNSLRGQLADVREKCKDFNMVSEDNKDLEAQIENLRLRLHELGFVEAENSSLGGQLEGATKILNERIEKVKELTEETIRLNDKVANLENEKVSFQSVKEEYDNLRARFDEMESTKQKALTDVAPLKAKVARLSQKCQEKNSLIKRLVDELQVKGGKSALLDELRLLEVAMTDTESDIEGPITSAKIAPHLQASRVYGAGQGRVSPGYWSSSSSDCRDLLSDTELISPPQHTLPQRPRSAEQATRPSHPRRRLLPRSEYQTPNKNPEVKATRDAPQLYLVLADYDPQFFSKSDKPWLELGLKEGDRVKVIGPVDHNGYCEAEVNNKVGLVPASYLQPLQHSPDWYHSNLQSRRLLNLQSTPRNQEGSPEKIMNMFQQLNTVQPSPIHVGNGSHFKPINNNHQATQTKGQGQSSTTQTLSNSSAPDPPSNFKIRRIVGGTSLVLSWTIPSLDNRNYNNGSPVTGYRILCNGQVVHQTHSPLLCKAVLDNISTEEQQTFSIQTIAANGLLSTSCTVLFTTSQTNSSDSDDSDEDNDADLSSILSKVHQGQGEKRRFIGVYDYNPKQHSPQDLTGQELTFQTGDEITVFGNQRPDGFYHAELNGKKGLVPARFIEELPPSPSKNKSTKVTYSPAPKPQPRFRSTASLRPGSHKPTSPPQTHL